MSKPNRVPKFGNWGAKEQMPFTIVFEKARADHKGGTGDSKTISPNDPFEIPAAFGIRSTELSRSSQTTLQQHKTNGSHNQVKTGHATPSVSGGPVRSIIVDYAQKGSLSGVHDNEGAQYCEQTPGHPSSLRAHPGNRSAVLAYLGSDKKGVYEGSAPEHHPLPGKRHLPASRRDNVLPGRGSLLPKFGAWDEKDPMAGDVFTLIFGNARKEKIIGGPIPIPTYQSEISVKENYEDVYKPPPQSFQRKVPRWLAVSNHEL